jgi:hypothetical protein
MGYADGTEATHAKFSGLARRRLGESRITARSESDDERQDKARNARKLQSIHLSFGHLERVPKRRSG